jgi:phospholipid N-methyltransferase
MSSQTGIESMPRGGPNASRLDRWLETDRLEYLDRDDVDELKRSVVRSLDRIGATFRSHDKFARIALNEIVGVPDPKILELGSGHGALSRALLSQHPSAHVTVTDVEPSSVLAIAATELGNHPRATVREADATAIDAPDQFFDLAVFTRSFHHLSPPCAARALAEGTRVATKLLLIDLWRPPPPLHIFQLAMMIPFVTLSPVMHDGFISSLRAYSVSALQALAVSTNPRIDVQARRVVPNLGGPPVQVVVAERRE